MTRTASETLKTTIWDEDPESDDPFSAQACYCFGYDVYGEILEHGTAFLDYVFLLISGKRPTISQSKLLNGVAVALGNPGPREASVYAAMNAGAGGTTHAGSLIAALAVGAGGYGGGQELKAAMNVWQKCCQDLKLWEAALNSCPQSKQVGIWPEIIHRAGFSAHGKSTTLPVRQTIKHLSQISPGPCLPWLHQQRQELEALAGSPVSMTGVAAAAFIDLGFDADYGEILYLWLRLPGAAAHAIEQEKIGLKRFPFYSDGLILTDDPGAAS
jgi:citrate synthase